jgi:hypothetical protein
MTSLDPRPYVLKPASGEGVVGKPTPLSILTPGGKNLMDEFAGNYVSFRKADGTPLTGKHVIITVTNDGTDIDNIVIENL